MKNNEEKLISKKIMLSPVMIIILVIVILAGFGTSYAATTHLFDSNDVNYDNTESGLESDNVKGALDELFQHATDYTSMDTRVTEIEGKVMIDKSDSNNAGFHNSIFRGKNLGTSVTNEQWTAISNGTFDDLYVGDYWVINNVNWRIAGFDIYYGKGDTAFNKHHAVIVPDTNLTSAVMNDTNTTEGGYVGSKMYTTTLPSVLTTITNAFGSSHVLEYRNLLTTSVGTTLTNRYGSASGASNSWAWQTRKLDLMNENQVYGSIVWSSSGYETGTDNVQFPLFRLKPEFINKQRSWYWLRNVTSASFFAGVGTSGASSSYGASYSYGVRPCFYIG